MGAYLVAAAQDVDVHQDADSTCHQTSVALLDQAVAQGRHSSVAVARRPVSQEDLSQAQNFAVVTEEDV